MKKIDFLEREVKNTAILNRTEAKAKVLDSIKAQKASLDAMIAKMAENHFYVDDSLKNAVKNLKEVLGAQESANGSILIEYNKAKNENNALSKDKAVYIMTQNVPLFADVYSNIDELWGQNSWIFQELKKYEKIDFTSMGAVNHKQTHRVLLDGTTGEISKVCIVAISPEKMVVACYNTLVKLLHRAVFTKNDVSFEIMTMQDSGANAGRKFVVDGKTKKVNDGEDYPYLDEVIALLSSSKK